MIHDYYEILQLKSGPELHQYRFLSLDQLSGYGLKVDSENYCCVYSGSLEKGMDLETLYYLFNMQRPEDFYGHSMSVSDVVVLHKGGVSEAWYCDRAGFRMLPDFFPKKRTVRKLTSLKRLASALPGNLRQRGGLQPDPAGCRLSRQKGAGDGMLL